MGIITWEKSGSNRLNNDLIELEIKELDDGIETGNTYKAKLNKNHKEFGERMKVLLKEQIVIDRVIEKPIDDINVNQKVALMDFENFETFISTEV